MPRRTPLSSLLVLITALLGLTACGGYHFASQGPFVLDEDKRTVAIDKVTNPTAEVWLEPRLRQLFRDELNRRGWTQWVDKGQAKTYLDIRIHSYLRRAAVTGQEEKTLLLDAIIRVSASFVDVGTGRTVWDSGEITLREPYQPGDEDQADYKVTDLAVRALCDRMSENY